MLISALVVTWNSAEHITSCLEALLGQRGVDLEIVVVDNASSDETATILAAYTSRIHLLRQQENLGYAAGNNVAATAATGAYLWLVNPDCAPDPECAQLLLQHLRTTSDCGVAAAVLRYPDGRPQSFARREPTHTDALWVFCETLRVIDLRFRAGRMAQRRVYAELHLNEPGSVHTVDCPAAACVLLDRQLLETPLFDPSLPLFFNDADLYRRLRSRGYVCHVVGSATAVHGYGASLSHLATDRRRAEMVASLQRYESSVWPLRAMLALRGALVLDALICMARSATRDIGRGTWGALGLPHGSVPWLTPVEPALRRLRLRVRKRESGLKRRR